VVEVVEMEYRDVYIFEGEDGVKRIKLEDLFINLPKGEDNLNEAKKRGEFQICSENVFPPGKYFVEANKISGHINRLSYHKMYNFTNVKAVECNSLQFEPELFTFTTPLIPPVLTFTYVTLIKENENEPVTFEMEIYDRDDLDDYIKGNMNVNYGTFRYRMGVIQREEPFFPPEWKDMVVMSDSANEK
jgi:hypothetical protein